MASGQGGAAGGGTDPLTGMGWTVFWAGLAATAAGLAVIAAYNWRAFPLAVMWAAACGLGGGLVGFLFGIPKTGRRAAATVGADATATGVRANTNLEEVSDWVTKILIGVTLTQYDRFLAAFREGAGVFAAGLGGGPSDLGFASAVMVAFAAGGWLFGYLQTLAASPVLGRALTAVEKLSREVRRLDAKVEEVARVQEAARLGDGGAEVGRVRR